MIASYEDLAPNSKIWIYQIDRALNEREVAEINSILNEFVAGWVAHNQPVKGFGKVYANRFIVLMADEQSTMVSGCSIDSSVKIIKQIGLDFNLNLFDRVHICYIDGEEIRSVHMNKIQSLIQDGAISLDTIVFNTLVKNKSEFETQFKVPLKKSWLGARLVPTS